METTISSVTEELKSSSRLVVYVPTYRNFDGALRQVAALQRQQSESGHEFPWVSLRIVLSINGGAYDEGALRREGADNVIWRPANLEGDTNIALGFLEAQSGDFLWILSDNDPVRPQALVTVATALREYPEAGMVVASSDPRKTGSFDLGSSVLDLGGLTHVGLISAVIYRYEAIVDAVPIAFQTLWTGWSQIAVQDLAVLQGKLNCVALVPTSDLIEHTRGNQTSTSVERARTNYSHSFYGGGLRSYVMAEVANGTGRQAISQWWRRQWLYASAYRPPMRPFESKRVGPQGEPVFNYRAGLAEALVRTGSPRDRALWLLSWLPYWRLGLLLKRMGIRSSRWT